MLHLNIPATLSHWPAKPKNPADILGAARARLPQSHHPRSASSRCFATMSSCDSKRATRRRPGKPSSRCVDLRRARSDEVPGCRGVSSLAGSAARASDRCSVSGVGEVTVFSRRQLVPHARCIRKIDRLMPIVAGTGRFENVEILVRNQERKFLRDILRVHGVHSSAGHSHTNCQHAA
jgi:hypothetical protein